MLSSRGAGTSRETISRLGIIIARVRHLHGTNLASFLKYTLRVRSAHIAQTAREQTSAPRLVHSIRIISRNCRCTTGRAMQKAPPGNCCTGAKVLCLRQEKNCRRSSRRRIPASVRCAPHPFSHRSHQPLGRTLIANLIGRQFRKFARSLFVHLLLVFLFFVLHIAAPRCLASLASLAGRLPGDVINRIAQRALQRRRALLRRPLAIYFIWLAISMLINQ